MFKSKFDVELLFASDARTVCFAARAGVISSVYHPLGGGYPELDNYLAIKMNKSRSSRKNRLEKKKRARAYAREMAEKEFKLLLKDFETSGGPRLWKKLEEFSKKGKYQRQLFEYKFKIISDKKWAAMNKKRTKSRQKKETWLDRIARSSSFKPLQGGAPG